MPRRAATAEQAAVSLVPAESLDITGPAGVLEARLEEPQAARTSRGRFAVICHPHPLHGGTLENKVVSTLARCCVELGVPALRFNFRGVGRSQGQFDEGRGESDDALAVIDFGHKRWPGAQLWLAGFSFGAWIAARVAVRAGCTRLVTIAPPVARFDFNAFEAPRCPWLIVQGDADQLVNCSEVLRWAGSLAPAPTVQVMHGVDHFFHGRLTELRAAVLAFARE
jgi:alpha/beta superfamily hydrolase